MKLLKTAIFLLSLMASILTTAAPTSKSAAETMRLATQRLKQMESIEASFTVTVSGNITAGQITLADNKFRLTTPQISTWFDGKTQWTYAPSTQEVSISQPTPEELAQINPFEVIGSLQNGYTPRRLPSDSKTEQIELTPRQKSDYKKIILSLNKATLLPEEIRFTASDDTVTTVKVSSIKKVKQPAASAFRFNPRLYPGIEIIDLR